MSIYSAPSISGYNSSPPSDDGSNTSANEVTWAGIKTKIGDPVKTYAQAISSAVDTAFGKIFLNAVSAESSDYTVVTGDRGKLLSCTNTITITLVAAATAGDGFPIAIKNSGSGVVTVDGYSSETINGQTTFTLYAGTFIILSCDGSNWHGITNGDPNGYSVVSGYTWINSNYYQCDAPSIQSLTRDTCTAIAAPANAKYVEVWLEAYARGAGSAADRYSAVYGYTASGCGTAIIGQSTYAGGREPSGLSSGTLISADNTKAIIPVSSGYIYLQALDDVGNQGTFFYAITGYFT